MSTWLCQCGLLVKDKRFCPRCKWMKFDIKQQSLLSYSGGHVGYFSGGLPFLFPPDLISNHVMVVGQTGTGKTRFAQCLLAEIQRYPYIPPIRFLIIDVEGTYGGLIPYLKGKVGYFDMNKLRINPFDLQDPALIRELFRESVFKDIEEEFVDLSAQMQFVLQEAIADSTNMMELIDNIKHYSKHRLTAIEKTKTALMVRLDPFLRRPLKEIFMCKKSNPDFHTLGDTHAIIDLHALDALVAYNSELRLIYNTITTYFLRKMLAREETDSLTNVFVADEAQLLVPRILQKVIVTQSFAATQFATRLRKRGCGLLLITQSSSNLEQDIFKNSATKVVFRLQNQEDIKMISDAVGFVDMAEYEYLSNVLVRLERKQAIVCTLNHEPFLITARDFEPLDFANYEQKQVNGVDLPWPAEAPLPAEENGGSRAEVQFLDSIKNEPFLSVTERRANLGWDYARFTSVVDSLTSKGKIEAQKIKLGRGSPRLLFQMKGKIPSVRHDYYIHWLESELRKKGLTQIRKNANSGPDIEIQDEIAIEVELGTSNILGNISNDSKNFQLVIVCSDDRSLLQSLQDGVKEKQVLFLPVEKVPAYFEKKQG